MTDEGILVTIDGRPVKVAPGTSVAVAVLMARNSGFRRSV